MNDATFDNLLRQILDSLLPVLDKRVLVLFTGGLADAPGLLAQVDALVATEARIAVSPAFLALAPAGFLERMGQRRISDEAELRRFLTAAHLTVVPILTRNTLVKASLGIQDSLVTNAMAATLMAGLPLIGIRRNYHPDVPENKEKGYSANPAYNALLLEHERRLAALGATLLDEAEFAVSVKRALYPGLFGGGLNKGPDPARPLPREREPSGRRVFSGAVLARDDVAVLPEGTILTVAARAVITPLALDQAARRRIRISRG